MKHRCQAQAGDREPDWFGYGFPGQLGQLAVVAEDKKGQPLLLGGAEADWTVKKGAIWWFSNRVRADETQTVLRIALAAEFLM